ncbi:hypothetical protein [Streptomyces sp. NPDC058657]|uniref:hypothetical protein n=1 Tax=unclassified Streptomyces TaxID=2593676 RepID=UPI00364F9678
MTRSTTWTASTAAEAKDVLEAALDRLESSMKAAYPGINAYDRTQASRSTHVHLDINFLFTELETTADDRSTHTRLTRD